MSKITLIIVIFVATLIANQQVSSQSTSPTFRYKYCRDDLFGTYTANSTYADNLVIVLSELSANASTHAFYNSSSDFGLGGSTVYGQYYCRGDVNTTFCGQCVLEASLIALNCSNAMKGIVWFEQCTLRYSNESMFGVYDPIPILRSWIPENITNPEEFTPVFNQGMGGLIQEAAHGNNSAKYFATTQKEVSTSMTAYFLAQCSSDLSEGDCELCLTSAVNVSRRHAAGQWPVYLYSFPQSCQAMYDTGGIFYFTPGGSTTPPIATHTPPPSEGSSEPSPPNGQDSFFQPPPPPSKPRGNGGSAGIKSEERMKLGIITIALVLLMLVIT